MISHEWLGIIAGALYIGGAMGMYIYSVLKGETKPNRVTWWILGLITIVVVLSYHGVGARETLWLPVAYAIGFLSIGALSLKYGDGPFVLNTLDRVVLLGGVISIVVYWFAHSPGFSLLLVTITEGIALAPTAIKAYRSPMTESRTAWTVGTIASVVNLFAITEWSLAIAGYPMWIFLSNSFVLYFLFCRRA